MATLSAFSLLDDSLNGSLQTWQHVVGWKLEILGDTIWQNEKWTSGNINLNELHILVDLVWCKEVRFC